MFSRISTKRKMLKRNNSKASINSEMIYDIRKKRVMNWDLNHKLWIKNKRHYRRELKVWMIKLIKRQLRLIKQASS